MNTTVVDVSSAANAGMQLLRLCEMEGFRSSREQLALCKVSSIYQSSGWYESLDSKPPSSRSAPNL